MLPLVFVLLAIALIVGPIMMMQPNSRQRKEIALRDRALKLGMRVHILPLKVGKETRHIPAYCLPWKTDRADHKHWLLQRRSFEHDLHFSQRWDWVDGAEAGKNWHEGLQNLLPKMPDSVLAVSNGPQGVCIYWTEKGEASLLDTFAYCLKSLAEIGE